MTEEQADRIISLLDRIAVVCGKGAEDAIADCQAEVLSMRHMRRPAGWEPPDTTVRVHWDAVGLAAYPVAVALVLLGAFVHWLLF